MSTNSKKSPFKKYNVKTFLFFLLFTSILWIFIQFSKNYTQEVAIGVNYTNIPEDKMLNDKSDQTLRLVLNGNGFRLMSYTLEKKIISLSIDEGKKINENEYSFELNKNSHLLSQKLGFSGNVMSVRDSRLSLFLDDNLIKKIPVRVVQDVVYAVGYGSDFGIQVLPDSVTISGPSKIIDTIQFVETEKLTLKDLNEDYQSDLKINKEHFPKSVSIIPREVSSSISVEKITEGTLSIPIVLKNIPVGVEVKIFPKETKVVYKVSLAKYKEITAQDFVIVADYAKAKDESLFLNLELTSKPDAVHDIRIQDKQVQFVVLKNK